MKLLAGPHSLSGSRGESVPCVCQLPVALGSWACGHIPLSPASIFFMCPSLPLLSLIRTPVIGWMAHLGHPGSFPYLKIFNLTSAKSLYPKVTVTGSGGEGMTHVEVTIHSAAPLPFYVSILEPQSQLVKEALFSSHR